MKTSQKICIKDRRSVAIADQVHVDCNFFCAVSFSNSKVIIEIDKIVQIARPFLSNCSNRIQA